VVATAIFAYGGWRYLRSDQFGGQSLVGGTWEDLKLAAHLHFDVPEWQDGLQADLWMVAGTLALGMGAGIAAGTWCAAHRGTVRARALESAAMVLFCLPPWVAGYGALLLFEPAFGAFKMPLFFTVHVYQEPYQSLWDWFRALLVPWLIAGLPLFGACLRMTLAGAREAQQEEFMRTASAKGLSHAAAVRRHARPAAMPGVFAFMSAGSAAVILNIMMVETVFSVPGLLSKLRRALSNLGGVSTGFIDAPTIQLCAIWGAVLVVIVGIVFDVALMTRDPRVRASGRLG
jgi:peptide/nickel transport system permease protein